ncbi:MAG: NAD(P)/FAD-dependent oxidoreductase [Defluviitaleaceae bacterium]|nr:NAD(P)/FAD-dependent oxidoreductase [Defluviitaleaceae bacterium]MCL2262246.1 NAD(P)/FAD-dependent oxidoreductase [Defluviitaleaceae bacterium]
MIDCLIIGGGPAGATAAVYVARAGLGAVVVYKDFGALETAESVENFYGFVKIGGKALVERGLKQARKAGAKTIRDEVVGLKKEKSGVFTVETVKKVYKCKTVLLAVGAARNAPRIQGLKDFEGRGISYCAICDGFFYRGKDVAVLGSGAYALHEVKDLLPLASSVTVLTNGREPEIKFPAAVTIRTEKIREITGAEKPALPTIIKQPPAKTVSGITFETGEALPISGIFVADGIANCTDLALKIGAAINENNSIQVDDKQHTTIQGLWSAGDCTGGLKQIAKAAHEGTQAGISIIDFLRD